MILPTVVTLADDALRGVPASQRQAAQALGLTRTETILSVSLPQALPGLLAAVLLGLGRALGETIAVFMVVGRQDNQWPERLLSLRPLLEPGRPSPPSSAARRRTSPTASRCTGPPWSAWRWSSSCWSWE